MSAILDVVERVRLLLEPDDQVEVDEGGAAPKEWATAGADEARLYVFPDPRLREVPFESGPTARQDFTVHAVLVAPSAEEALKQTDAELSAWLDEKRGTYLEAVRLNRTTETWHHLVAAERPAPRTLTTRSLALELSGYRFVS